jgi:hypothetical protein
MPSSARRIAANRANAQKSTGPKSLAGKARAALNAFRHGLATKRILVHGEEAVEFERTRTSMLDHYQPLGQEQTDLFDDMFSAFWRMRRAQNFEQALFEIGMTDQEWWSRSLASFKLSQDEARKKGLEELEVDLDQGLNRAARAFKGESQVFHTLSQYEARLSRQYLRFRKELRTLQEKDAVGGAPNPLPGGPNRQGAGGASAEPTRSPGNRAGLAATHPQPIQTKQHPRHWLRSANHSANHHQPCPPGQERPPQAVGATPVNQAATLQRAATAVLQ